MTLDEAIELDQHLLANVAINHKEQVKMTKLIQKWLTELRDRREVELKPAMKFINQGFSTQLGHMRSEIKETEEAYVNYIANGCVKNRQALWDELTDLQVSAQTAKYMVFCNGDIDIDSHKRVIVKNKARGYYDE